MNRRCIQYRDVKVAPGSDMFAALEAGDTDRAARIYAECEREYRKHYRSVTICIKCFAVNHPDLRQCAVCYSPTLP